MSKQVIARFDPTIRAQVLSRWPLYYTAGPDPDLDRPAHVRAGSGLASIGERLAVIQDDANFVAIIEAEQRIVESIALPSDNLGIRQFDDLRGNKWRKLDLEACIHRIDGGQQLLIAFGSGSSSMRERVLMIEWPLPKSGGIRLFHAPKWYGTLRCNHHFSGSELNIEGAAFVGTDCLRLFQRGNGAPCQGRRPVNATCDVSWMSLRSHLDGNDGAVPDLKNIVQYDLGSIDGVRLSFTDVAVRSECVHFIATAEASPNTIDDGPVAGSAFGQIDADGSARWTHLLDEGGNLLRAKVEGLSLSQECPQRGWILTDLDDPRAPTELCELSLDGAWSS